MGAVERLDSWAGPRPEPDIDTASYWHGLTQGRLVLRRCLECSSWIHRPRAICQNCLSDRFEDLEVPAEGTVYTYTNVYREFVPGIAPPYTVAIVDVDSAPGVRLVTKIVNCDMAHVRIGMAVRPRYVVVPPEVGLLFYEPADGSERRA
jgi:uncharacterized protein